MLVLSRRIREQIVIGDNIRVTVIEISGTRVRLAIEAPTGVSVDRQEVWESKQRQKQLAHDQQRNQPADARQ